MWTVVGGPYNSVFIGRRVRRPIVVVVETPALPTTGGADYGYHKPRYAKPQIHKKRDTWVREELERLWDGTSPQTRQDVLAVAQPEPAALFGSAVDFDMMHEDMAQRVLEIMRDAEDDEDFLLML